MLTDSNSTSLFFELIRISIGQATAFHRSPNPKEWENIYEQAKRQTLLGVLYTGLERLPKEQRPPFALIAKWYALTQQIEQSNKQQNALCTKIIAKFQQAGFHACILKGQGIASLYPQALRRQLGDIDVWLLPHESVQQGKVFPLSERRKKICQYVHRFLPNEQAVYHHIDFSLVTQSPVEIHFTPSWLNNYFANRRLQKWFASEAPKQFQLSELQADTDGAKLVTPDLKFNYLYILLHIYRHLFSEGIGLRQVMDYYYVVLHFAEKGEEREEIRALLQKMGLASFYRAMMWVLQEVFALPEQAMLLPPDTQKGAFLLKEILMAGNFGQHDKRYQQGFERGTLKAFCQRTMRNLRFITNYPSEVIWSPCFKIWHQLWIRWH